MLVWSCREHPRRRTHCLCAVHQKMRDSNESPRYLLKWAGARSSDLYSPTFWPYQRIWGAFTTVRTDHTAVKIGILKQPFESSIRFLEGKILMNYLA